MYSAWRKPVPEILLFPAELLALGPEELERLLDEFLVLLPHVVLPLLFRPCKFLHRICPRFEPTFHSQSVSRPTELAFPLRPNQTS